MANIVRRNVTEWNNYHFNGPFATKMLLILDTDRTIDSLFERYNDSALTIQDLINESIGLGQRLRACGSGWSLSNIAHQKDRMLFNYNLDIHFEFTNDDLHPTTTYRAENLFAFQCGTGIKQITGILAKRKKSLKTCGASNGQTIAGAISTGVHGSAIDVGSIQDCIVGIQLIVGPGKEDLVYIERETLPALNNNFAKAIRSRVLRNDDLFNATLVGLGSFGIIHGVVLEAEDIFLLKRYVKKIGKADALQIAESMDFTNANFKVTDEIQANGTVNRPYHYKLYINPYNELEDYVAEIIYKKKYAGGYPNPVPLVQKLIFKDLPTWIASFSAKHNWIIPKIINALRGEIFPETDKTMEGTLGEIFWDTTQSSKAFGCAFGIDNRNATRAVDRFIGLMNEKGPIPGILSTRFVKATKATLGFTRFPVTCILEVDGTLWQPNSNMISLESFLTEVVKAFRNDGIPFTLHWGKNGPWSFPGLVDMMYGNADDEWKDMRSLLLTKQMADLFSNDFLDTVKLSDYRLNTAAAFAELKKLIEDVA